MRDVTVCMGIPLVLTPLAPPVWCGSMGTHCSLWSYPHTFCPSHLPTKNIPFARVFYPKCHSRFFPSLIPFYFQLQVIGSLAQSSFDLSLNLSFVRSLLLLLFSSASLTIILQPSIIEQLSTVLLNRPNKIYLSPQPDNILCPLQKTKKKRNSESQL